MSEIDVPLILASASPRRRELLSLLGVTFEALTAPVIEFEAPESDPREMVLHNAALKAAWACAEHPDAWVLAADTTVALGREILNKPANLDEARAMLRRLSGRTHVVYTGVCLWRKPEGPDATHCEMSEVAFQTLDEARISTYLAQVNPLDKAGAYGIQEGRELILARYRGSFTNIMGLPLEWVAARLHERALIKSASAPSLDDPRFRD
jgi:septum formation protein